jgi:hypothetical protein
MKSSYQNKTSLFPNMSSDVSDDDIDDFGNKIASTGECLYRCRLIPGKKRKGS